MTNVLEQINDAFFALDHDWNFTYLNAEAEKLLQRSRDEMLGTNIWQEFAGAIDSAFYTQYHIAVTEQKTVSFEEYYPLLDTWFEVRAYPTSDGLAVYLRDITQQKKAEHELRESQERLNRIIETNANGIVIIDIQGQIIFANAAAERILGLERDLITGRTYNDPMWQLSDMHGKPLSDEEMPFNHVMQQKKAVYDLEFAILHPDNTQAILTANAAPLWDEHGEIEGVVVSFVDRTAYKRTETAQELLVRASSVLAEVRDPQAMIRLIVDLLVPNVADWCVLHLLKGDNLEPIAVAHAEGIPRNLIDAIEAYYAEPTSRQHPLAFALYQNESLLLQRCSDVAHVAEPHVWEFLHKHGCQSFIVVPLVARKETIGVLTLVSTSILRPYTEAHLHMTQDLARRVSLALENSRLYRDLQDVLKSRDELFSMVTHDLKNPLGAIIGYTDLLERRFKRFEVIEQDKALPSLRRIHQAADKMTRLLDELLDVASIRERRQLALKKETVDLVQLIQTVYETYQDASPNHPLRFTHELEQLIGFYDQARIERVIDNLVSNALKYSPEGGEILIKLQTQLINDQIWANITIQDFGIGIPRQDFGNIFQRFQRGSNVGTIKGNGIGLASARYIVEQHAGTLEVESTENEGSTFTICLPVQPPE